MQTVNGVEHAPSSAAAPESSADTVQLPEDVKSKLKEPLPREAVSPNPQKPGLSVIKVIYVVERLNEVFGLNGWHVDNEVVETGRMVVVRATLSIPRYAIAIEQFGGNDNPDRGDAYKGACTDALSKCASQSAADCVRMLLLCGARKSEVAGMRWSEVDLATGRYGWDGGLGSVWRVDPAKDLELILLSQRAFTSPIPPDFVADFIGAF